MVDGRTDDNGRRTDDGACLYYKLTNEPLGSGELKSHNTITILERSVKITEGMISVLRARDPCHRFWCG